MKILDGQKYCTKCQTVKGVGEFGKSKCEKDGLQRWCKECRKQYYQNNRKDKLEYQKEYYHKNREYYKEYHKEYQKEYNQKNKDKGLCTKCSKHQIMENNQTLCVTCWFKYRSCKATGTIGNWQYLADLAVRQGGLCAITGEVLIPGVNASVDHILPRSTHPELIAEPSNLQWVTFSANATKGNNILDECQA